MTTAIQKKKEAIFVGAKVRSYRTEQGMTQRELARKSEISFVALNRIEQGLAAPSWAVACRIVDALKISLDSLRK